MLLMFLQLKLKILRFYIYPCLLLGKADFLLSLQPTEIILELYFVLHHTNHSHLVSRYFIFSSMLGLLC